MTICRKIENPDRPRRPDLGWFLFIRTHISAFKTAITVKRLPKTRSGKILRGTMRKIADKEPWKMPATIDDPAILDEITEALKARGIGV